MKQKNTLKSIFSLAASCVLLIYIDRYIGVEFSATSFILSVLALASSVLGWRFAGRAKKSAESSGTLTTILVVFSIIVTLTTAFFFLVTILPNPRII